jgi:hypothetical protein
VDGVHALFRGHCDNSVRVQIGLHRTFPRANQVRFVGFEAMQAEPILL